MVVCMARGDEDLEECPMVECSNVGSRDARRRCWGEARRNSRDAVIDLLHTDRGQKRQ